MSTGKIITALALLFSLCRFSLANVVEINCHDEKDIGFSHVVPCYREKLATHPVNYTLLNKTLQRQVIVQNYQMISQAWSPGGLVQPTPWLHQLDFYIPEHPLSQRALLVINNGINHIGRSGTEPPNEFGAETLAAMARATQTIVISVGNEPNQYLTYKGDATPLREDDSVARSWALFMDSPQLKTLMPLHIPMAAAVSQAMRVARQELAPWHINRFIVTGASKRGWAAWLAFVSDPDVDAVVPFVIDLLDTREALHHMYRTYGGNWPIAFYPYYQQGIDTAIDTPPFSELMKIEDPLQYLAAGYRSRLSKTKYIVNASGDDFYAADNARFYYDALPGEKALRVVPNTDHGGIKAFTEQTLVAFVNRFQHQQALPQLTATQEGTKLVMTFSEKPVKIKRWTASNKVARDFRYACGIKYSATSLNVPKQGSMTLELGHKQPGWQATFIEATFHDGLVATSRVYITPDEVYPSEAPPVGGPRCATLPGRGMAGAAP